MSDYIRSRKLSKLKENPINSTIYDDNEKQMKELVESIKINGLLEPLVITEGNLILSGHRRYKALQRLGIDSVECRVAVDIPNANVALIEMNKYRTKTPEEKMREGDVLEAEYKKVIKKGRPKKDEPKREGKASIIMKLADALNTSETKLKKMRAIRKWDSKKWDEVNMGLVSVEKAYQYVRKTHIIPNELKKTGRKFDEGSYDRKKFRASFVQLLNRYNPAIDDVMRLVNQRYGDVSFTKETTSSDDRPMEKLNRKDIKYAEVKKYNPTLLSKVKAGMISLTEAHNIIRSDMMNLSEVKGKGTKSNKTTFKTEFDIVSKRYKPSLDDWIEQLKQQFPYTYKDKIKE